MSTTRREFLKAAAIVAVVGSAGLAGCTGSAEIPRGPKFPNEPDYEGWFDGTDNYEYTYDMRGKNAVTIEVGAKGNMGDFGFGPAAVAVSPATTVTWEWIGRGGAHNVVAEGEMFTSGEPVDGEGTTFEHTFDKPGIYKYVCEPHESMGMKGTVLVAPRKPAK